MVDCSSAQCRDRGYISEDPLIEVSDETRVLGTVLVEMVEPRKIMVEIFLGQTREQVRGFILAAQMYVR